MEFKISSSEPEEDKQENPVPYMENDKQERVRKRKWTVAGIVFLLVAGGLGFGFYKYREYNHASIQAAAESSTGAFLIREGYYPLTEAMAAADFQVFRKNSDLEFVKVLAGNTNLVLYFDFDRQVCEKKGYTFSLADSWMLVGGTRYVSGKVLQQITNYQFEADGKGQLTARPVEYQPGEWATAFPPLIANAGGAHRGATYNHLHTNGLSALIQNYDIGHRVFEIDFAKTADGQLAAVHKGLLAEDSDQIKLTANEWLAFQEFGAIGPMMVDDVMNQMLINTDLFIVADSEQMDYREFMQLIYDAAGRKEIRLLDRVIPQIYSAGQYDEVMAVYDFPSIIFNVSKTSETPLDIVKFCDKKNNITVLLADGENGNQAANYSPLVANKDLLLYVFSINDYQLISDFERQGVDGYYTDILTPAEMELFQSIAAEG